MSEGQLIWKARQGDSAAFEALVTPHEQTMWRVCCHMMGSAEDAADALQQAMLRAWRSLGTYRGEASVGTWLYRIAVSACLDALRARKARPSESLDSLRENGFDPPAKAPDPAASLEKKEEREQVREALNSLPEEQRLPLLLFAVEQKPYEEVALLLSLPVGTVKSRIARARIRLAKILSAEREQTGRGRVQESEGRADHEL